MNSSNHIVQIGRHRFVSGLFWQSLSRRNELRKEELEIAKNLNFDLLVLRIDRNAAVVGFANSREGAQAGLSSLGMLVSKTISTQGAYYDGRQQPAPNWLGAFKLPDGRWAYFAVRDGAFLPNGDVIGTRDEIFERLNSDYGLGGWNVVIGDEEIEAQGFHNFYQRRIEDMIPLRGGKPHVPRWLRLTPVERRISWRMVAAGGAVAACLAVMLVLYLRHVRNTELAMEAARERIAAMQRNAPANIPHPWIAEPKPAVMMAACLSALTQIAPSGWQMDSYVCRPGQLDYTWSRNDSTVSLLLLTEPSAQIDNSGDHASMSQSVPMPAGGDDALGASAEIRARVLSRFQTLGIPLTLTPQVAGQGTAPPAWQMWRLVADLGEMPPGKLVGYLNEPGMRVEKLSYQSGQWALEGVLYAN